jgi:hypothetical protein
MNSDDFAFAPPPFKPEDALHRLKRELRDLGLSEREGKFERRGQAIARASLDGGALTAAAVKRPGRSPEWQPVRTLKSAADLRDFVAALKTSLARWNDSSSD